MRVKEKYWIALTFYLPLDILLPLPDPLLPYDVSVKKHLRD